jgi:hypothetical protein
MGSSLLNLLYQFSSGSPGRLESRVETASRRFKFTRQHGQGGYSSRQWRRRRRRPRSWSARTRREACERLYTASVQSDAGPVSTTAAAAHRAALSKHSASSAAAIRLI